MSTPAVRNALPKDIKDSFSANIFESKLKTWHFKIIRYLFKLLSVFDIFLSFYSRYLFIDLIFCKAPFNHWEMML